MKGMNWITSVRGLDPVLLDAMGVREVDHPSMGESLMFPYFRRGESYAAKFRTVEKDFRSSKDVTRGVYNEDALSEDEGLPIVITEGEIDCLTVLQAGYSRVVSLPDGWTAQGNKTDALLEIQDKLFKSPFVIVAGDNDEAGESLPRVVATILAGHDVRYVEWPDGCKDANDVLTEFGEAEIVARLQAAKRIDPPGGFITGISDLPPMSRRRVLRSGVDLIDRRIAFELGAISVATGVPGSGKSTFTTWAAEMVAQHEGIRVGLFGFETHAHTTRNHLAKINTGRGWEDLSARDQHMLGLDLDKRWKLVGQDFGEVEHCIDWLWTMVYTLAVRDQCKLIIIDPWNELEHLTKPGETITSYINDALRAIRQWAEKLEVHICVVAHPKKLEHGRGSPKGYDIADSAAWANKPSLGFTVHKAFTEAGTPYVELVTWKVRDSQLYGIFSGVSAATFDVNAMTYEHQPDLE